MSQDTERTNYRVPDAMVNRYAHDRIGDDLHYLAREVQELRHLRDNVLPDLRQELDNANAHIAQLQADLDEYLAQLEEEVRASRKLVADLRALPSSLTSPAVIERMIEEAGL